MFFRQRSSFFKIHFFPEIHACLLFNRINHVDASELTAHIDFFTIVFNNIFAKPLEIVNVSALNKFEDGATVNVCDLLEKGILSKCEYGVKILGNGSVSKKLTVRATAFSASAKEKIEAAGGKAEVV